MERPVSRWPRKFRRFLARLGQCWAKPPKRIEAFYRHAQMCPRCRGILAELSGQGVLFDGN